MSRVIGVWNVAPASVWQSPVFHAPVSHAQLESCTATDLIFATRRSSTSSSIWLKPVRLHADAREVGLPWLGARVEDGTRDLPRRRARGGDSQDCESKQPCDDLLTPRRKPVRRGGRRRSG